MRKEILPTLLVIVIVALAYSLWVFQTQIADAEKQSLDLQNQLSHYENLTDTLQTQVNNLEAQLSDLQTPIYNVTIENITSTPWGVVVGVAMSTEISIIVKNIGVRDVGGLTAEFKILTADGNVWDSQDYEISMTAPEQFGVLHVQESKIIKASIQSNVGVPFAGKSFAVTLMLDKTVLDEHTLPLPAGILET